MTKIVALAFAIALGCGTAHAQNWSSYELGHNRYYQGTDRNGGNWHGSSYELGGNTYTDMTGPNGETKHCTSYKKGGNTYTNCN